MRVWQRSDLPLRVCFHLVEHRSLSTSHIQSIPSIPIRSPSFVLDATTANRLTSLRLRSYDWVSIGAPSHGGITANILSREAVVLPSSYVGAAIQGPLKSDTAPVPEPAVARRCLSAVG